MTSDLLLLSLICGVGLVYSVIAGRLGWQETLNENTGEPVPHPVAAINCFAWGLFFLFLAAMTVCFPGAVPLMSAASRTAGFVYTFIFDAVAGLLLLAAAIVGLAAGCCSAYNAWINGKPGTRAALIVALSGAALLLKVTLTILHPSAHAIGRALVRLWLRQLA